MSQKTIQRNKEKSFKTVSRLAKIMSNAFSNCVVTGNVDLGEHYFSGGKCQILLCSSSSFYLLDIS